MYTIHGLATLRRGPRVHGDKGRQDAVSGPKGMGQNTSGLEQTDKDKDKARNGNKTQKRENRSSNDREGTIDISRVGSETKR